MIKETNENLSVYEKHLSLMDMNQDMGYLDNMICISALGVSQDSCNIDLQIRGYKKASLGKTFICR